MALATALSIQYNEPSERFREIVPETMGVPDFLRGNVLHPPARPQNILGYLLLMGDSISEKAVFPVVKPLCERFSLDSLVHVNESVRGVGQVAKFHRLPVASAPWIIDGPRTEETLAVEPGWAVAGQPFGERLRVAPQDIDDGWDDIPLHVRLSSLLSDSARPAPKLRRTRWGSFEGST